MIDKYSLRATLENSTQIIGRQALLLQRDLKRLDMGAKNYLDYRTDVDMTCRIMLDQFEIILKEIDSFCP